MTDATDRPIASARASTAVPTDDALPVTRTGDDWVDRPAFQPRGKPWWKSLAEWGGFIVAALLIAFVVKTFIFQAFYIPSESMVPTLEIRDRVLVNKLSYRLHDVNRGDVVVFEAPNGTRTEEIKDLVKRVIGLPGEAIAGRDGRVYIDGNVLEEPWLPEGTTSRQFQCTESIGCVDGRVPPDSYFVLGDNRLQSKDSTYFGPIAESAVIGRAFIRIWPINRIAFIGPSYLVPILVIVGLVALFFLATTLWSRRRAPAKTGAGTAA